MSTERTGGLPPIDHGKASQDTKAAREEKQKVEKVRAVDADEEAQKRRKFRDMMMGDEDLPADLEPRSPSPFETEFYASGALSSDATSASVSSDEMGDFGDLEDSAVPSPTYSSPPNVSAPLPQEESSDEENALPQSDDFWENLDSPPDLPLQSPQFDETPQSQTQISQGPSAQSPTQEKIQGKKGASKDQGKAASPFGPPGKPSAKTAPSFGAEKKPSATPESPFFAAPGKPQQKPSVLPGKFKEKTQPKGAQEEIPSAYPSALPSQGTGKKDAGKPQKTDEKESSLFGFAGAETALPLTPQGQGSRDKGKDSRREMEIAAPSLPTLPADVQPMAQTAATQAAPYLRPETLSLFYQMVGTIYVMTSQSGVSRTEIVLNNPNFADSKFFGATITIEKYETAPDSFNIRLTGSQAAVTSFKENIPSLMTAFQNGNFTFRVNRVEAEYSVIKPFFRRKEKGEGGGQSDSGSKDRRK